MTDEQKNDIKSAAIRGLRTALFTFIALFIPSLFGFFQAVTDWAASGGTANFPETSTLVLAAVSAATAALSGLVGFLWNWLENSKGFAIFGAKKNKLS